MTTETMDRPGTVAAVVSRISTEGEDARLLRLELPEAAAFSWRPGQFVPVTLPGSELAPRHYSIANPPQDAGAVEFLFERRGPLAEALFRLSGGESVELGAPVGKWTFRDEDRHAVLVSSGTGVAPLRAMVRYALEKGLPNKLDLFYSDRTPGRLLFRRELEEAAERGVGVHLSVTEPEGLWEEGQFWDGPRGPVTVERIREAVGELSGVAVYMCGGGKLIDALRPGLKAAGVQDDAFRVEKWGDY
ncbi:FAD-dependent oxidoreductase [bacterium]|nr:MAG: FAD-dependent oxidoreductase [bacterium]